MRVPPVSLVLPILAALLPAGGARADTPMVVTWTTWLRSAASERSRALDEIGTGTVVQVAACAEAWCRVVSGRASGYLPQRLLAASIQQLRPDADRSRCFPGTHFTPEGPIGLTLCPAVPAQP